MKSVRDLGRQPRIDDLDVPNPLLQPGVVWSIRPYDRLPPGSAGARFRYADPGDVLELLADAIGPPRGVCVLDDTVVGAAAWAQVPFAEQYEAVTERAVAFVAGAMRYLRVRGPDAAAVLDLLTPTDVHAIGVGRAAYAIFTTPAGTVDNEAVLLRAADDEFLLSCGGTARDPSWLPDALAAHPDATVERADIACFNIKGPGQVRAMSEIVEIADRTSIPDLRPFEACTAHTLAGHAVWILKTIIGLELWGSGDALRESWERILGMRGLVTPGSWDLLDVFRLECERFTFGVYPIDLHGGTTLREIGQDRLAALAKPRDFVGRDAFAPGRDRPPRLRLTGLEALEPDVVTPPMGEVVHLRDGAFAGYVTTAAHSPRFGRPLAFAHLRAGVQDWADVVIDGDAWRSVPLPFAANAAASRA